MTTGEKIKTLRKKLNMTQEAFASSINVSRRSIMDWEHDKYSPQSESIMEICKVHHIDLSYFIDDNVVTNGLEKAEEKVNILKGNLFVTDKDKKLYKKEVISKNEIYKWYRLFLVFAIAIPLALFFVCAVDTNLINYLLFPAIILNVIFYILFRHFRKKYDLNLFNFLKSEITKETGAIIFDYPIYIRSKDNMVSFFKKDELIINVKEDDIKKIVLFMNNSMYGELLPKVTKNIHLIEMQIYYSDGNKSIVSVFFGIDTKFNKLSNKLNKIILIESFNKFYIKCKK